MASDHYSPNLPTICNNHGNLLLTLEQANALVNFVEKVYHQQSSSSSFSSSSGTDQEQNYFMIKKNDLNDFQMNLTIDELNQLIADPNGFDHIEKKIFQHPITEMILRRVVAHGQGIPKHLDHAKFTMQVALNSPDEYDGCRLFFLLPSSSLPSSTETTTVKEDDDFVCIPERPIGSYTIHDNTIIHGVSRMTRGIRYSLFFLSHSWDKRHPLS
jgi:hypothetical protein